MIRPHRELLEALWRRVESLDVGGEWARPMDLGGHNGSDHGQQLARLVAKGWAERKAREPVKARPSFLYRITAAGRDALFNARALDKVKP